MKKLLLFSLITLLLCSNCITEYALSSDIPSSSVHIEKTFLNVPYAKYYNIDKDDISMSLRELSKEEKKKLSKDEKKYYSKVLKIEKYLSKNRFDKALKQDSSFMPSYVKQLQNLMSMNRMADAMPVISTIIDLNRTDKIFDDDNLNFLLGLSHFSSENYSIAYNLLTKKTNCAPIVEYKKSDDYKAIMSTINYKLGKYQDCINYSRQIETSDKFQKTAIENSFLSYLSLSNKTKANEYAKKLVAIEPVTINYVRLADTLNSNSDKLKYFKLAKNVAQNDSELTMVNNNIANIEQNKINSAIKKLGLYVRKPDWKEVRNSCQYGSVQYWSDRQDKFFAETNSCMANYTGKNLVDCFNSVRTQQEKLTKDLKDEVYKQEQLQLQNELIRQQEIANRNAQQLNYEMRQLRYDMNSPRYYSTRRHHRGYSTFMF